MPPMFLSNMLTNYKRSPLFDTLVRQGSVDPFLNNVVLHLKGDGANNSTNIIDSSPAPKTINVYGDAKISTAQSKYGQSSIFFDGNGDYLRLQSYADTLANFTFECWAYVNIANLSGVFATNGTSNFTVGALNNSGTFRVQVGGVDNFTGGAIPLNQWFHYAVVRSGSTVNVYVNGLFSHSIISETIVTINNNLFIGAYNATQFFMSGYLDSVRITKILRYTANFNPETDTYLAY